MALESITHFWHDMTPREKIFVGVAAAGTVGYALYVRHKSSQSSAPPGSDYPLVDSNGVPLAGTDLNGVFSTPPGGTGSTGSTGTGTQVCPAGNCGPPTVIVNPPTTVTGTPTQPKFITVTANQSFNTLGALYHNYPSAIKALNPGYASFANHDILPVGAKIQVA